MADTSVDCGHGTSVTFHTSVFTAELVHLRLRGLARRALESSHMGTTAATMGQFGNRTYQRNRLEDPGQLIMDIHFNRPLGGTDAKSNYSQAPYS